MPSTDRRRLWLGSVTSRRRSGPGSGPHAIGATIYEAYVGRYPSSTRLLSRLAPEQVRWERAGGAVLGSSFVDRLSEQSVGLVRVSCVDRSILGGLGVDIVASCTPKPRRWAVFLRGPPGPVHARVSMLKLVAHRAVVAVAASVIVLLGSAVTVAASKHGVSCDARPGSTVLENGSARVFTSRGAFYACARRTGRAYRLHLPPNRPPANEPIRDVQLSGGFVGWEKTDVLGGHNYSVLDVNHGSSRVVATADPQSHQYLGRYVLNSHGTVVWILNFNGCINAPCSVQATVYESTAHHTASLDRSVGASDRGPVDALGLSGSGSVAYWLDHGSPRDARIP